MAGGTVGDFRKMLEGAKDEDMVVVEMIPQYKVDIRRAPGAVKSAETGSEGEKAAEEVKAEVV